MDALQESRLCNSVFAGDLLKAVEQHVNNDDISAEGVNAWGEDKIEGRSRKAAAAAKDAVQRYPGDKSKKVRAGKTRDSVPEDYAGVFSARCIGRPEGNILDTLRIKMNFAIVLLHQTFEEFGKRALGAMTAIQEWRNNREPQVSGSSGCPMAARPRSQIARRERAWAGGTARQATAKGRRSK